MTSTRTLSVLLLWLAWSMAPCGAFSSVAPQLSTSSFKQVSSRQATPSSLQAGLFGNLFGQDQRQSSGVRTVFEIPALDVKTGALRFFLQIYLVGESNKPEPGAWVLRQNEDRRIDMYFQDGTGMCSIDMTEYAITVQRHGQKPSLRYMLQESVLLHGLLDELNTIAFEVDDIEKEKRLLRLKDPGDDIELAREKLPAKIAKE